MTCFMGGVPVCRCATWVETPAMLFHVPNHENLLHYLNDGFLLVLQTLIEAELLPARVSRSVSVSFAPSSTSAVRICAGLDTRRLYIPRAAKPLGAYHDALRP